MVYHIKGKITPEEREKLFKEISKRRRKINVRKFAGVLKSDHNPVTVQRKLRDEWD